MGRDVHVTTTANAISSFLDGDKTDKVCFRCGQTGHRRYPMLDVQGPPLLASRTRHVLRQGVHLCAGEHELRTPWKARCVRVVKQHDRIVCLGCNSTEHTFRRCPYNQGMLFL